MRPDEQRDRGDRDGDRDVRLQRGGDRLKEFRRPEAEREVGLDLVVQASVVRILGPLVEDRPCEVNERFRRVGDEDEDLASEPPEVQPERHGVQAGEEALHLRLGGLDRT